jgi:ABC-type histidine transport system ATPase subunit
VTYTSRFGPVLEAYGDLLAGALLTLQLSASAMLLGLVVAIICAWAMIGLAQDGMMMLCVTHEMGFARSVADRVMFMDRGEIVEEGPPSTFFGSPKHERTCDFLGQILSH